VLIRDSELATDFPFTWTAVIKRNAVTENVNIVNAISNTDETIGFWFAIFADSLRSWIYDGTNTRRVSSVVQLDDTTDVHHVAVVWATGSSATLYVDGVASTTVNTADTVFFPTVINSGYAIGNAPRATSSGFASFDGTIDDVVFWDRALDADEIALQADAALTGWDGDTTGERVTRILDCMSWPSALRDIDTGDSTLGPANPTGTALAYLQSVEGTENGSLFVTGDGKIRFRSRSAIFTESRYTTSAVTFTDAGTPGYMDLAIAPADEWIRNHVTVTGTDDVSAVANDSTSQQRYLRRPFSVSTLITTNGEALDHANWTLGHYKDPQTRIDTLTWTPRGASNTNWSKIGSLELDDRLSVTQGGTTFNTHVEQIDHDIGVDGHWFTTYTLSPVNTADVGVFDVGTFDESLWGY
jgi:hypothetical protein